MVASGSLFYEAVLAMLLGKLTMVAKEVRWFVVVYYRLWAASALDSLSTLNLI